MTSKGIGLRMEMLGKTDAEMGDGHTCVKVASHLGHGLVKCTAN